MIKKIVFVMLASCSLLALDRPSDRIPATGAADAHWKSHCQQMASDPEIILNKLKNYQNRLSFTNHGGLFNGGVCWWHSRLTRIAQYLAVFNPNEKPLTADQAYLQVKRLRQGKPTTINGFKNFYDFSLAHYPSIQKNLEEWQITSGGFELGFLDGLAGSTVVPADQMKMMMDQSYQQLHSDKKPIYQVLQLPGITAHAWLMIDIQPTSNGYQFSVVDSNYSGIQTWTYQNGSTGFYYGSYPFVSYTTRRGILEERALTKRLTDTCTPTKRFRDIFKSSDTWPTLDEELDAQYGAPNN